MAKIVFNFRDELVSVDTDMIAAIKAEGNYSLVVYINEYKLTLSLGISKLYDILKERNNEGTSFVRVGRSIIINHRYLQRIDMIKQLVVLTDKGKHELRVKVPKNELRHYKDAVANKI